MRITHTFTLAATAESLWPLVANTESLNREIGLPAVTYEFVPLSDGGSQIIARASLLGRRLEWIEHPFEWVAPRQYEVEREFRAGPFRRIVGGTRLAAEGGRTRVEMSADYQPAGLLGRLAGRSVFAQSMRQARAAMEAFDSYLAHQVASAFPRRAGRARVNETQLAAALAQMRAAGMPVALGERLAEHLRTAPDEHVVSMRPFELAQRWRSDRTETLRLFMAATRAGIVDLTWHVICPTCRGSQHGHSSLREVHRQAHCPSCNIRFDADFDRAVELRFSVSAAIRATRHQSYCIGGPMNTPHVLAQQRLREGETRRLSVALAPGNYLLRCMQCGVPAAFSAGEEDGKPTLDATLAPELPMVRPARVAAGAVEVVLRNAGAAERLVRIERAEWGDLAVSAALCSSLQDFRDLFTSELLAPGEELAIRSLTILFTDLRGSTALYERIGDASAYVLVRDHFRVLRDCVRAHGGAIVKTMGDAVMAVFLRAEDGVEAALRIQRDGTPGRHAEPDLRIKVGLHAGPCIAVTANGALDYFGTAVNLAQRVQSESRGGDITLSEALVALPEVRERLRAAGAEIEPFLVQVKGFSTPVTLHRVVVRSAGG